MNLTVNARDAMPNGGSLDISAENLWVDESYARMHMDAEAGPYIVILLLLITERAYRRKLWIAFLTPFLQLKRWVREPV